CLPRDETVVNCYERGLENQPQSESEQQPVKAAFFQVPHVSGIREDTGRGVGTPFQADTTIGEPLPSGIKTINGTERIKTSTATTENVRSYSNRTNRPSQDQISQRLVHESPAVSGHIDIPSYAEIRQ